MDSQVVILVAENRSHEEEAGGQRAHDETSSPGFADCHCGTLNLHCVYVCGSGATANPLFLVGQMLAIAPYAKLTMKDPGEK